ncbi:hypothetical protein SUGI_0756160 [Cryptomeria japonica]|nr:hypothetical protein SUGI_0756160 [Cryptomeria japonica]
MLTFRVVLLNGSNLSLTLENSDKEMSVQEVIHSVKRKCDKEGFMCTAKRKYEEMEKESRSIQWGTQTFLEDTMGNKI